MLPLDFALRDSCGLDGNAFDSEPLDLTLNRHTSSINMGARWQIGIYWSRL
jgi:hypothetical protein